MATISYRPRGRGRGQKSGYFGSFASSLAFTTASSYNPSVASTILNFTSSFGSTFPGVSTTSSALMLSFNLDLKSRVKALDFNLRVLLSFRSPFSTWRFRLKIKAFTKQNMFYRSDILHDFSISSF